MERLRRAVIVMGSVLAVWFYFYADLTPLVTLRPSDRDLRANEELVPVEGQGWQDFLARVDEAAQGLGSEAWRSGPDQEHSGTARLLFFRPDEGPMAEIAARLAKPYGFVRLESQGKRYGLQRLTLRHEDFHFGSGYVGQAPPDALFRPYRFLTPWLLGLSLLAYVFIPWPRREPGDLAYQRYRVVLSDVLGMLLFGAFFTLPFCIIGGSVEVFVVGWPLLIGLWFLAALGLLAVVLAAWSSAFVIRIGAKDLKIRSFADWESYPFSSMTRFGPAIRRNPGWFRTLSFLAAFAGRSGGGAAALAATQEYGGLGIELEGGDTLFIWICTPLGAPTIEGAEAIPEALRAAGIPEHDEARVYVGFGRAHRVPTSRLEIQAIATSA